MRDGSLLVGERAKARTNSLGMSLRLRRLQSVDELDEMDRTNTPLHATGSFKWRRLGDATPPAQLATCDNGFDWNGSRVAVSVILL